MALGLVVALLVLTAAACDKDGNSDGARSVAPPSVAEALGSKVQDTLPARRLAAHWAGWQEGRRQTIANEVTRAQSQGPGEFRSKSWGRLFLILLVTLVTGLLARIVMALKLPAWWPWQRKTTAPFEDPLPLDGLIPVATPEPAASVPLALDLWRRAWRALHKLLSTTGRLLVGPAPGDHVWRREIHQSRDAERDLAAAASAAAELAELRPQASASSPPSDQPSEASDSTSKDSVPGEDKPKEDASQRPAIGDTVLAQALATWRGELATARRRLEHLEPLDHRRELLAALNTTQATAAELRVALTRALLGAEPVENGTIDYWRRLVGTRPRLDHLTPAGGDKGSEEDDGWGHQLAVAALAISITGLFSLAAWAAAGSLPMVFGLAFGIGGPVAYGVARVQLDRSGRPRLLPGVADRLATRVATITLGVTLLTASSLMFGGEVDLGDPPRLEMPAELRAPIPAGPQAAPRVQSPP